MKDKKPGGGIPAKTEVYAILKDAIIYNELRPGEPMRERDLADRFGISRTPLREILQQLHLERLLVIRPRKGVFVAPIDMNIVRGAYEVRLPLEKQAAALAARRATPGELFSLQELADGCAAAFRAGDHELAIRLDRRFHERLAAISGNEVLYTTLEQVHILCLRCWYQVRDAFPATEADINGIVMITEALRSHDAKLASHLAGGHVASFLDILDEFPG